MDGVHWDEVHWNEVLWDAVHVHVHCSIVDSIGGGDIVDIQCSFLLHSNKMIKRISCM